VTTITLKEGKETGQVITVVKSLTTDKLGSWSNREKHHNGMNAGEKLSFLKWEMVLWKLAAAFFAMKGEASSRDGRKEMRGREDICGLC